MGVAPLSGLNCLAALEPDPAKQKEE